MFLAHSPPEKRLLDIATIILKKISNYFIYVEILILEEKWNKYESHIFPRSLLQTCWLEKTSLCLNTRLNVNNELPNSHYLLWNLGNRLTFICSPLLTSIIFHPRRPKTLENISYEDDFYVSADNHISHLGSWRACYSLLSISPNELCTKTFRVFGRQ